MSIDYLQKRIRKLKNPLMVAISMDLRQIPQQYRNATVSDVCDCVSFCKDLLLALKDIVPAVRLDFGSFSVWGNEGVVALSELLCYADSLDYYILLDAPESWSPRQANLMALGLFSFHSTWTFDGLLLSCYMGSDVLKPFTEYMVDNDKDLFVALRTGNKSASEIQDLLTGSRLVHTAAADMVKRMGEGYINRSGYSRIAGVGPATSSDILQNLRSKYPTLFLLVDGLDYSGGNAKNCAQAFDKLGHGAVVCASTYVTEAWRNPDAEGEDPIACCVAAAERLQKNLNRYVTVL